MKKTVPLLFCLVFLCSCSSNQISSNRQSLNSLYDLTENLNETPTGVFIAIPPAKIEGDSQSEETDNESSIKFRKITSIKKANNFTWLPDGKFVCQLCTVEDGSLIQWGIIDPITDSVEKISGLEYFLPVDDQKKVNIEMGQIIDDYIFSMDGKSMIVLSGDHEEVKPGSSRTIFNQNLTYYSLENGSRKIFTRKPLEMCINESLDGLVSWSSDNRYLLGYCWASFSDSMTFLLFDTSNQTYFDLRKIADTDKPVSAALSNDGRSILLFNYSDELKVFDISNTGNFVLESVHFLHNPQKIYWSKDDLSIIYDNQGSIQQQNINGQNSSEKTLLDIDSYKSPEQDSQNLHINDWYLSSNFRYILLVDNKQKLWIYDLE